MSSHTSPGVNNRADSHTNKIKRATIEEMVFILFVALIDAKISPLRGWAKMPKQICIKQCEKHATNGCRK